MTHVGRIDNFDASGRFLSGEQIRSGLCKSDAGAAFVQHQPAGTRRRRHRARRLWFLCEQVSAARTGVFFGKKWQDTMISLGADGSSFVDARGSPAVGASQQEVGRALLC
jgi:hypothetical protein